MFTLGTSANDCVPADACAASHCAVHPVPSALFLAEDPKEHDQKKEGEGVSSASPSLIVQVENGKWEMARDGGGSGTLLIIAIGDRKPALVLVRVRLIRARLELVVARALRRALEVRERAPAHLERARGVAGLRDRRCCAAERSREGL